MPTLEYTAQWYPRFGVKQYHDENVFGSGVSVYVIDTGLANVSSQLNSNLKLRTVANAMAPKNTHGSFVASIMAARRTQEGHSGIVPEAQVYMADVGNPEGRIYTSYLVNAINDAVSLNVDIITISLGTATYDQALEDAVNAASRRGILLFAAAGNCRCRSYEFPAACDAAISVASLGVDKSPSAFNTRNDAVALWAPGQSILVPTTTGTTRLSGTSFAAPFAAGLAALVLSKLRRTRPGTRITRDEMVALLRSEDHLDLDCAHHNYANNSCILKGRVVQQQAASPSSAVVMLLVASAAGFATAWTLTHYRVL